MREHLPPNGAVAASDFEAVNTQIHAYLIHFYMYAYQILLCVSYASLLCTYLISGDLKLIHRRGLPWPI